MEDLNQNNGGQPTPQTAPSNPQPQPQETGAMIPKYRFDEVARRAQEAEAKVVELQKLAETVSAKEKRIAELEKELSDTKAGYELEKSTAKKNSAIEAALRDKVVDMEVVSKLLDSDKITIGEDGTIKGLEEQVKSLKQKKPYLWKAPKPVVEPSDKKSGLADKTFAQQLAEKKRDQLSEVQKAKTYF